MPDPVTPSLAGNVSRVIRTSEKIWLPVWKDRNDVSISNSCKQHPVTSYYDLFSVGVYRFTVVSALTDTQFRDRIDTLNSTTWRGWPRYCAWLSEIHTGGVTTIGDSANVEEVTYVIRCIRRSGGWRFSHPDIGYTFKTGSDYFSFSDEQGSPPIGKLNGSGDKLAMGSDPIVATADVKNEINFASVLGF